MCVAEPARARCHFFPLAMPCARACFGRRSMRPRCWSSRLLQASERKTPEAAVKLKGKNMLLSHDKAMPEAIARRSDA